MAKDEFGLEVTEITEKKGRGDTDEFGLKVTPVDSPEAPGKTFAPRERLSVLGELKGGWNDINKGVSTLLNDPLRFLVPERTGPSVFQRDWKGSTWQERAAALGEEALAPLLKTGLGNTLMGALRLRGSLFANLQNPTAALGDTVEKVTGSKGAGNTAAIAGDVAMALLAGRVQPVVDRLVKSGVASGNKWVTSGRMKTDKLGDELNTAITDSAAREAGLNARVQSATTGSAAKEASIASNAESAIESAESIAQAERMSLPTAKDLRARFAANAPLGKEAGAGYQQGFNQKFEEAKDTFEKIYNPLKLEASTIPTTANEFVAAGGKLKKDLGITETLQGTPEKVAGRIPKNLGEEADDTYQALKEQLNSSYGPERDRVQGVIDEFLGNSKVPDKNATVRDLINERQRLSDGYRAMKSDNDRRKTQLLIDGLDADIAAGSGSLSKRYAAANQKYKEEYVPYFSKGSVTREIAQGTPERVIDSIYRPTVSASGKVLDNKSVESITRARELIKDPAQWEKMNKSFMNKGIEQAMENGAYNPDKHIKWWASYKDPTNTGNEVLRKGLGETAFKDIDAVFSQLGNSKRRSIDDFAKATIANYQKQGKVLQKGEQNRLKEELAGLGKQIKAEQTNLKTSVNSIEKQINETLGTPRRVAQRLESIGSGVFTTGVLSTAMGSPSGVKRSLGGLAIALGARELGVLISSVQGRNPLKALLRSAPGSLEGIKAVKAVHAVLAAEGGKESE